MYEQIVVGTDGSAGANVALDAAVELACLFGARLHIVNVHQAATRSQRAPTAPGVPASDLVAPDDAIRAATSRIRDEAVERAGRVGVNAVAHSATGDAADAIVKVVEDTGAQLVVVGNRGMSGFRRFVLGSVPDRLSHRCPCSVLIVDTAPTRQEVSD